MGEAKSQPGSNEEDMMDEVEVPKAHDRQDTTLPGLKLIMSPDLEGANGELERRWASAPRWNACNWRRSPQLNVASVVRGM